MKHSDSVELWLRDDLKGCTPQTLRVYGNSIRYCLRALSRHGFAPDDPDAAALIRSMLCEWAEQGLSKSSIARRCDTLRRYWAWLNRLIPGSVPDRCFAALKPPRFAADRPPIRTLSEAQQAALFGVARGYESAPGGGRNGWPPMHLYTFIAFGLLMGLRPHELCHLDWRELKLGAPRPYLQLQALPRRRLKNPLAAQALTLAPGIEALLIEYFDVRETGPLFPIAAHRQCHRTALKLLGAKIGAPWLNLYVLRRTCITNWHRSGVELQRLTILSRHSNPVILNRHYLARPPIADIETGLPVEM
jgi:integrase